MTTPSDLNPEDGTPREHGGELQGGELPDALRWQLRAMRRDTTPEQDLWPDIARRLQATREPARPAVADTVLRTPATGRSATAAFRPRWQPAMAAALFLAAVATAALWRDRASVQPATTETLVQVEADHMTRQYQAAMLEIAPVSTPVASLQPAFDDLDRNTAMILEALRHDPNSRLLLDQLRRTYARRLALAQRAAYA